MKFTWASLLTAFWVGACVVGTTQGSAQKPEVCSPACGTGYKCVFVAINCFTIPCPDTPGKYQCVVDRDYNPCITVKCSSGYHCEAVPNSACTLEECPAVGRCVEDVSTVCDLQCKRGYKCELQVVNCIRAPCPPIKRCVLDPDFNPCATVRCRGGTHCQSVPNETCTSPCPPTAKCVPDSPACNLDCMIGYKCELRPVICKRAPCPPVPQCVVDPEYNPCAAALCLSGTRCESVPDPDCTAKPCLPIAQCIPINSQVCNLACAKGFKCELEEVQCIRAPCPRIPQCVVDPNYNPCAVVRCRSGTHCEAVPNEECTLAPCPMVANCVPNKENPCNLIDCKEGLKCIEAPNPHCKGGGTIGKCAPLYCEPNPCLYTKCAGDSYCVVVDNLDYPACLSDTECCPVKGDCRRIKD